MRRTPLQVAAETGHAAATALFIERGATIDAVTTTGDTALLLATSNGHAAAVQVLLNNDADPYLPNAENQTPLYRATLNRKWFVVRQLMAAGVNLSRDEMTQLAEDPSLAAPLHETRAMLLLEKGDLDGSIASLEQTIGALERLADAYRLRAVEQRKEERFIAMGRALVGSIQTYAQTEARLAQARSNAQIAALAGAGSTEDYFARNQALQNVYERSITVDNMARQYDQYDWMSGWSDGDTSRQSEQDARYVDSKIELVRQAIDCLAAERATDNDRAECAKALLSF